MYTGEEMIVDTSSASNVDLIESSDVEVKTVAELKTKKAAVRTDNLNTLVEKLTTFTTEDIVKYPISTVYQLLAQAKRIVGDYDIEATKLKAALND